MDKKKGCTPLEVGISIENHYKQLHFTNQEYQDCLDTIAHCLKRTEESAQWRYIALRCAQEAFEQEMFKKAETSNGN